VKPLLISEAASLELAEAIHWYEERRPGWGGRLFDAVTHAIEVIEAHPEIGSSRPSRTPTRQLAVRGFPYLLVYRDRGHDLYAVAFAHAKRRPGYWRNRS
jgi:plasmid stabilization system protein ParE